MIGPSITYRGISALILLLWVAPLPAQDNQSIDNAQEDTPWSLENVPQASIDARQAKPEAAYDSLLREALLDLNITRLINLRFGPAPEQGILFSVSEDELVIAPYLRANVTNRQEARALIAAVVGHAEVRSAVPVVSEDFGIASYVLAAAALFSADDSNPQKTIELAEDLALDGPDRAYNRAVPAQNRNPNIALPGLGRVRATKALSTLTKIGGCSGPLIDLMNRLDSSKTPMTIEARATRFWARSLIRNIGSAAYPPDHSCV